MYRWESSYSKFKRSSSKLSIRRRRIKHGNELNATSFGKNLEGAWSRAINCSNDSCFRTGWRHEKTTLFITNVNYGQFKLSVSLLSCVCVFFCLLFFFRGFIFLSVCAESAQSITYRPSFFSRESLVKRLGQSLPTFLKDFISTSSNL